MDCLEEAQFTSEAFTGVLKREGITIQAWTGAAGRLTCIFFECLWRSVKHEDVNLKSYSTMGELLTGLTQYFAFCNGHRMHQAVQYSTLDERVRQRQRDGTLIVEKFPRPLVERPVSLRCTGSFSSEKIGSQAKPSAA